MLSLILNKSRLEVKTAVEKAGLFMNGTYTQNLIIPNLSLLEVNAVMDKVKELGQIDLAVISESHSTKVVEELRHRCEDMGAEFKLVVV